MKIKKDIYNHILNSCPIVPPETGGIIGARKDIIDTVAFDNSSIITESAVYIPNVEILNCVLREWQKHNISFCGLFHSHLREQETLSGDDIRYIQSVFSVLPSCITELYFPIVIPKTQMLPYKAINQNHNFSIVIDKIDIVP